MNWSVFSDCCESKIFPAVKQTKKKSVLALDKVTYQTFLDEEEKRPDMSWNEASLADSIER